MKILNSLIISLLTFLPILLFTSLTFASNTFRGVWTGPASMISANDNTTQSIEMKLAIELNETHLIISDCITAATSNRCYDSKYEILNTYDVYEDGRKIGTAYTGGISIFNGNSQVSEQMIFQFNSQNQLRYRYTYANLDNQTETRFGILDPK